jgi:hypothetical protein
VVRQCFALMALHDNLGEVLRFLRQTEAEIPWTMYRVRRMLTSDVYRGVLRWGTCLNETAHEAIISERDWDLVQLLMARRDELPTGPEGRDIGYQKAAPSDSFQYFLRGAVWCECCGMRMTPAAATGRKGPVSYYACVNGIKCGIEVVLAEIERCAAHPSRIQQRPNAEQVAGIWGKVLELWRKATGEERQEILSLLVDRISLKGRNQEGDKKIEGELRLILATPLRQVREFALLSSPDWIRTSDPSVNSRMLYR